MYSLVWSPAPLVAREDDEPYEGDPIETDPEPDLLFATLQACEEIGAVARIMGDADEFSTGVRDLQGAARMIRRTARVAEELVCELMEAEEARRARTRPKGKLGKPTRK